MPSELELLLGSSDEEFEPSWRRFLHRYSDLILHTVHRRSNGYDSAMDRYAFVLDALRRDGCERLRRYEADGRGRFTTWLVVVTCRLCEDFRRKKYGRASNTPVTELAADVQRMARQRLVDFVMEEFDPRQVSYSDGTSAEYQLRREELSQALEAALSELDPEDVVLLKLRYEDGLSAREIARVLRLPTVFHVYRRCNARLRDLRRELMARGVDGPRP